jgi:hypothetical protein
MQTTTLLPVGVTSPPASSLFAWRDFVIGLALTALLPALFWIAAFTGIAGLMGYTPDPQSLLIAGSAIAGFLAAFFVVLTAKHSDPVR